MTIGGISDGSWYAKPFVSLQTVTNTLLAAITFIKSNNAVDVR
jgi:hypothetical protein